MVNAALLWALLSVLVRVRRRHGVVITTLPILYPVSSFLLEMIRADNPYDTLGMTASQFVSAAMFLLGLIALFVLYRYFPERSRNAEPGHGLAHQVGCAPIRDRTKNPSPKRRRGVSGGPESSSTAAQSKRERSRGKGRSRHRSS